MQMVIILPIIQIVKSSSPKLGSTKNWNPILQFSAVVEYYRSAVFWLKHQTGSTVLTSSAPILDHLFHFWPYAVGTSEFLPQPKDPRLVN